jgi:hypothetical protein
MPTQDSYYYGVEIYGLEAVRHLLYGFTIPTVIHLIIMCGRQKPKGLT